MTTTIHTRRELANLAALLAAAYSADTYLQASALGRDVFDGIVAAYAADPSGFRTFALDSTGHAGLQTDTEVQAFRDWVAGTLLTSEGVLNVQFLWSLCEDSTGDWGDPFPCPVRVAADGSIATE